jgi:hypothetical protein
MNSHSFRFLQGSAHKARLWTARARSVPFTLAVQALICESKALGSIRMKQKEKDKFSASQALVNKHNRKNSFASQ